jgi:DNA-binding transcriptional LysR family regulator
MRLVHIRRSDLNLLPALFALLEERSISKAAARHHLSQPAMSRVLQRLRATFDDELLVRTASGYQLTVRARQLLHELRSLLPSIDRLLQGSSFDPATAEERYRLCCPDYVSRLFTPHVAAGMAKLAPRSHLEVVAWHEGAFDDAGRDKIDVVLWANKAPPQLRSEEVLGSEMVCVMSAEHSLRGQRLTLTDYLAYSHVMVTVLQNQRTMVDQQLNAAGHYRQIGLRVPFFESAVAAVQNTMLIATLPRVAVEQHATKARIRIVAPPFKFDPIRILMSWHPSTDGEPALQWFRDLVRDAAGMLK